MHDNSYQLDKHLLGRCLTKNLGEDQCAEDHSPDGPPGHFNPADWPPPADQPQERFVLIGPDPNYRQEFDGWHQLHHHCRWAALAFLYNPTSSYVQFDADGATWRYERATY